MTADTGLNPDLDDRGYLLGRIFAYACDLDAIAAVPVGVTNDATHRPIDGLYYRKWAPTQGNPDSTLTILDRELPPITRRAAARNQTATDRLLALIANLRARLDQATRQTDLIQHRWMYTLGHQHQWSADHRLITAAEIADRYGYASPDSARKEISRLGVASRGRDPESGAKLYDAAELDRAREAKPGQGKGGGPKRRP